MLHITKIKFLKIFQLSLIMLLSLSIVFSIVGCKKKDNSSNNSDVYNEEDDDSQNAVVLGGNKGNDAQDGQNGAGNSNGKSTNKSAGSSNVKYPSDLKGKTLEIFNWNPATEYPELPSLIKKFEKDSGVKVKWTIAAYADYNVELAARVAANNAPDVLRFNTANVSELELAQPISTSGYDFSGSDWDQILMKYYTVNGKCYAVNKANSLVNSPYVMTYNKNLISQYDFEDPYQLWKSNKWTWSVFTKMCQDYYKATKKQSQGCLMYKYDSYLLLNGYQGALSYANGRYGSNLGDEKCLKIWQYCHTINYDGTIQTTWDRTGFQGGKYLFMENMAIHLRTTNPFFGEMKADGILGVVPMPTVDGSNKTYTSFGEYEAYGIAKGSKNAKVVPYYLNYILDSNNVNKGKYFFSDQTLEVYENVMKNPNRVVHNRYTDGQMNSSKIDALFGGLQSKTADQLPTYVDSQKSMVDNYVKILNDRLSKLK